MPGFGSKLQQSPFNPSFTKSTLATPSVENLFLCLVLTKDTLQKTLSQSAFETGKLNTACAMLLTLPYMSFWVAVSFSWDTFPQNSSVEIAASVEIISSKLYLTACCVKKTKPNTETEKC